MYDTFQQLWVQGNLRSAGSVRLGKRTRKRVPRMDRTRAETSQAKLATARTTIDETTVVHDAILPILRLPLATSALCWHKVVPLNNVIGMSTCPNNKAREQMLRSPRVSVKAILYYKQLDHTFGIPSSDWIDTPPFSSAINVRQVSTSTSCCLALYTGCVTFHRTEFICWLPILVRSASKGGFDTTSVFDELASRNCI